MSSKLSSAQRSLNIAEKQYACTRMLRSAFAHPSSSPYALTCPHVRMHQQQQALFGSRTLGIDVGHAKAYMYSCRSVMHFTHRAKHARVDCMWITRGVALQHRLAAAVRKPATFHSVAWPLSVVAHRYARTRPVLPWALTCGASEASFFCWQWPY